MRSSVRTILIAAGTTLVATSPVGAQPSSEPDGSEPTLESATSAQPEAQLPTSWFETRITIEDLAAAGDLAAAAALSEQLIRLATEEFGPDSTELAEAYLLIAEVEKLRENFTAAETSILRAIEMYADQDGPLSPTLIEPFLNLGRNYDAAGDYTSAISAYGEARTIGRRNFGLLNEAQLEIIDAMTAAAEKLGDFEEAQDLQLSALTLVERNFDEFSLEAIEARYKYATWLRRNRRADEARTYYFNILRIINREYDGDPLMSARAYRERAYSFREEDNGDGVGLSGLRDALELLQEMPDPPWLELAQVHLDIGDWTTEFSRGNNMNASEDYLAAWQYLGRVDNGDELRRQWFDELNVVEIDPISARGLSSAPDAPVGFVEIRFTVDRFGRARQIEVSDSYPAGFKDSAFIRQLRDARFRPRIENGQIVEQRRARLNEFRFDPAILEEFGP